MMVSKLSLCFLVAFALFSFVSTDDAVEKTKEEVIPWEDPQFQKAFKLVTFLPKGEIVQKGIVKRRIFIIREHLYVTFKVKDLHIRVLGHPSRIQICKFTILWGGGIEQD